MPPTVLVGLVFPKLLFGWLVSPKRQILQHFTQQRNDDISGIGYLLSPGQSDLIRHHKIRKRLRYLLQIHQQLRIYQPNNQLILALIVLSSIVYLRQL